MDFSFIDPRQLEEITKVEKMTSGKKITEDEFDNAVRKIIDELSGDPDLKGAASFIVPMLGVTFAARMHAILFREEE